MTDEHEVVPPFAREGWRLAHSIRKLMDAGDADRVQELLRDSILYDRSEEDPPWIYVLFAESVARYSNPKLAELFLQHGAKIDEPLVGYGKAHCPVINLAAMNGSLTMVRWLREHGADINHSIHGKPASMPLLSAAHMGHLDVVRYLVEHGAVVNFVNGFGLSPLDYAAQFNHPEVADYLRSVGAKSGADLPRDHLPKRQPKPTGDSIREHLVSCFGEVKDFPLHEIVPGDPPLRLLHVLEFETSSYQAIVTDGMSARLANLTSDVDPTEVMRRTELLVVLDRNWPLDEEAMKLDRHRWPIDWLRKIARWPFENDTCLRRGNIFANGEPPEPLADNTKQTCLLVTTTESPWGTWRRPDGEEVRVMLVTSIYTDERDFERADGMVALLEKFVESGFGIEVFINRPSVVSAGK